MAIRVGSARYDENGKIVNGAAGDQTGKEVSEQDFYMHSKGWYCLRPKDPVVAEKIAEAMRQACANNNIGYDQNQRLGVVTNTKKYGSLKAIPVKTEADCGTLIRACIYQATGIDVGEFYTGNEADVLEASGIFEKRFTSNSSADVMNGDVLVTKKKGHTVAVTSGRPRISEKQEVYKMDVLKQGSKGNDVTIFESIMKKMGYYTGAIDTTFGPKCVAACNAFQTDYPECGTNGKPDGSFGPKCWNKAFSMLK